MKKVSLGQTSLTVSRIAVGCWQLNPVFWGSIDQSDWRAAMDEAVNLGINFLDTADAYGDGLAEEILGRYFRESGTRSHWIVATKFYWDFSSPRPNGISSNRFPNTSKDYIVRACEASLRRMGIEQIDLYQMHAFDPLLQAEEVAAAVQLLKDQGKIRHFGVSNFNVEQMELLQQWVRVETLQPKYNLLERKMEAQVFPYCQVRSIGTLIYSPLERGFFSGKLRAGQTYQDHRASVALFASESLEKRMPALEKLKTLAGELHLTIPQFAAWWVLSHPAVHSIIIGTKRPEHLNTLTTITDAPMPAVYWHEAAKIMA